jgi:hypothetical protein
MGVHLPLRFPVKLVIEYRPNGVVVDHSPIIVSDDPEAALDEVVRAIGWERHPNFLHPDVWVDGAL